MHDTSSTTVSDRGADEMFSTAVLCLQLISSESHSVIQRDVPCKHAHVRAQCSHAIVWGQAHPDDGHTVYPVH